MERASILLAEANTIQKAKELKTLALTAEDWARRKGLGKEAEQHCHSYAMRAEIKMGEMLKATEGERAKGTRLAGRNIGGAPRVQPKTEAPTLASIGVTRRESSQAQMLASLPKAKQKEVIGGTLTPTAARREKQRAEVTRDAPSLPSGKFRVLYADPPWKYGDQLTEDYGPTRFHYPAMSITELCALPISDLAEEDAVLFLWVTSPLLPECFAVIRAWGFTYKASFVWDKIKHNMGHYNSVRHEFLLVCTRGSCLPDSRALIDSVQSIDRTEKHSQKPEAFRAIIDEMYEHGRKIELFARWDEAPAGWDRWGNES